jgi:DNA-binding NarL/FixJ family response regulator
MWVRSARVIGGETLVAFVREILGPLPGGLCPLYAGGMLRTVRPRRVTPTERDVEILDLLLQSLSNTEIADAVGLGSETVRVT